MDCLLDIVDNAARIVDYLQGMDRNAFETGGRTRDAVERRLERICEAVFRLRDAAELLMLGHFFGDIRGVGNRLRQAAVKNRVPTLAADAQAAANRLRLSG